MAENASASRKPSGLSLSKTAFDRLFEEGRVIAGPLLVLRVLPSPDGDSRWGFGVSRRSAPSAVLRNRTRRRLRAAVRTLAFQSPYHIVVMTKRGALKATVAELNAEVRKLLRRVDPELND